jgi:hypothetical protein
VQDDAVACERTIFGVRGEREREQNGREDEVMAAQADHGRQYLPAPPL